MRLLNAALCRPCSWRWNWFGVGSRRSWRAVVGHAGGFSGGPRKRRSRSGGHASGGHFSGGQIGGGHIGGGFSAGFSSWGPGGVGVGRPVFAPTYYYRVLTTPPNLLLPAGLRIALSLALLVLLRQRGSVLS